MTFDEISKNYAAKARQAVASVMTTKAASAEGKSRRDEIAEAVAQTVLLLNALKEIYEDLGTWKVNDQPITEEQKRRIASGAGREIGLDDPDQFYEMTKAASNGSYLQMVSQISSLANALRKS